MTSNNERVIHILFSEILILWGGDNMEHSSLTHSGIWENVNAPTMREYQSQSNDYRKTAVGWKRGRERKRLRYPPILQIGDMVPQTYTCGAARLVSYQRMWPILQLRRSSLWGYDRQPDLHVISIYGFLKYPVLSIGQTLTNEAENTHRAGVHPQRGTPYISED